MKYPACSVFFACALFAQEPSFDVASVKPAPIQKSEGMRTDFSSDPGRLTYTNVTLKMMIGRAYQLKDYQIAGPDWIGQDRYNLTATMPPSTNSEQTARMLQTLLADRFELKFHREPKELPVYALVAGKSGSKMETAADSVGMRLDVGRMHGQGVPMDRFADGLTTLLGRPVFNQTELPGLYNFDLTFAPDAGMSLVMMKMSKGAERAGTDAAAGPSIFTAIQEQLGLRLEARKAPVETLVVDHAQKVPSEN